MLIDNLRRIWSGSQHPFLQCANGIDLCFADIEKVNTADIHSILPGDVVALVGDFDPESIATLLKLLDKRAIVVPLTTETLSQHEYFFSATHTQYVFKKNILTRIISTSQIPHPLLDNLRKRGHPGLALFTTGTTGRPKAILHDFIPFISRYKTPRAPHKAISFLLFDHIGGINTLLHMLFNLGQIVSIQERTVDSVTSTIKKFSVELLPTTPTFLRMMSLYPGIEDLIGDSLKIISYGTERMDQPTLQRLCNQFPNVDFRQTYGMSELGILRIKSKSRDSLFMNVGGEGVETKVVNNILHIKAQNRMLGYMNSPSPFDDEGWYCTNDIVKTDHEGFLAITGRDSEIINIAGLKFMPSEVERECMSLDHVKFAKACGVSNPITGQYLELKVELACEHSDKNSVKRYIIETLRTKLPSHMIPSKVTFCDQTLSHRFKKL